MIQNFLFLVFIINILHLFPSKHHCTVNPTEPEDGPGLYSVTESWAIAAIALNFDTESVLVKALVDAEPLILLLPLAHVKVAVVGLLAAVLAVHLVVVWPYTQ